MRKKILVVDDDDSVRKSISYALQLKGGFETLEAEDGLVGLELARRHHPDLIISDVMMDHFDGYRLLETLKENPETADIPIIMMTVQAERNRERETGAPVEYLAKGFSLTTLLERVRSILHLPSTPK